ncbi:threonine dehydratase [Roseibium sp. TrichSKD4]|uniref:threonine/serine dehydratase n=1 Tax=Roseibium sp. TrichSKD4 TaxID=744980 RepID=UPI0001E57088|nr:threonine/serine dehydratase [Roseibium sp. TrichSKD4]EFO30084.1 threonine dehydratase [Roseibium sp. TrichSKD4]EFO31193.1 threonine dehydratase [Roseibium sp. TrichSKD4]
MYPNPDTIAAAAPLIAPYLRKTPMLEVEAKALGLPCAVSFKLEHTQRTGTFKVRGAFFNMLTRDVPETGVVAASGGNHGAAVAYAATTLGHHSRVFVPALIAKEEKLKRMRHFGAEVVMTEGSVGACMEEYAAYADATGALSVHPYDTIPTLTGQGTIAYEIEKQMTLMDQGGVDTIIVSTGGGGLIGGVAAWAQDRIKVVSVETEGTNTLERSLREGPDIDVGASGVAASSLGGPRLGVDSYAVIKDYVNDAVIVPDSAVFEAASRLWEATRLIGEPGSAVALAALTSGAYIPEKQERICVVLCGGNEVPDWFLE